VNKSKDLRAIASQRTWDIVNKAEKIIRENESQKVKVIETNLSLNPNYDYDIILDHQSRVIEVDSWEDYINEIKEAKTVIREAYIGKMEGTTLPQEAKIKDLKYDYFHLSCYVYHSNFKTKKFVYKII
jgi:hypothetical protein